MVDIHNKRGSLVAKYEDKTGYLEARDNRHRYVFNLLPGQSAQIESQGFITVITRLDGTAFTVGHPSSMRGN